MMSTTFAVVLLTLCLATGLQASTPYRSCSPAANPLDLRVSGCSDSPCKLYRGESVNAEWDWKVASPSEKLKPRVRVTVFGYTIPYDIEQPNACDGVTNGKCPLEVGKQITYALSMPILKVYPKISLAIEFALVDDNNKDQVCFIVDAQVADR